MDRRNIGIFAHVDAGKTTLTERLLQHCGAIRQIGAVDKGTAHTDNLDIERRRGISVRAACATMVWKDAQINLIDTPGHADFASEVERAMWALDGAVLLLSAVDGVQPQTELLFRALKKQGLPVLLFLNKCDREGADAAEVVKRARSALSARVVDVEDAEQMQALLAEEDEQALEDYLNGNIYPREKLLSEMERLARAGLAYPVYRGSALKDFGVPALLDACLNCLPGPGGDADAALAGVVFALATDKTMGRVAQVRLFSGRLSNRDALELHGAQVKVSQIRSIALEGRGSDIGELRAGEIGQVYGLNNVAVGDVLGEEALLPRRVRSGEYAKPLLMVKVEPLDMIDKPRLKAALEALSAEDPLLLVEEYGDALHARVMGAIQLEVLEELLRTRFAVAARFGAPNVVYRETISRPAVGFYAYTMPKPCWAVIKFQIDPLPRGSGVQFESVVPAREIMPRYQNQVAQAIPLAVRQGMLGWQVDDVKITLIGGGHHLIHTHPLDFIVATPVAFMDGLKRGGSTLLQPILLLRITAPEDCAGRLLSEVVAMRGATESSTIEDGLVRMTARVPLRTSVDFSVRLAALTSGRGALSVELAGYEECEGVEAICPRRGVHPLDTAKYILAARNALDGGIFDL